MTRNFVIALEKETTCRTLALRAMVFVAPEDGGDSPSGRPGPTGRDRDRLIEAHLHLVRALARRYASSGERLDDLVQVGAIGLINAVDRFDPGRGVALPTYAAPTIVGEIRRY